MPAPNGEGDPTVRPLSTSELGKWVRMILDRHGLLHDEAKITSHSCKAPLLSFLAKYGASIPDREILGGHTGRMKSVLTYSRDALAAPLYWMICYRRSEAVILTQCVEIWNDDHRGEAGRSCHRGRRWF